MVAPAVKNESSSSPSSGTLRVPPQALDAERALLGALLIDSGAFARVSDLLTEDSFYHPVHRMLFSAMRELDAHKEPIDLVTVSEQLRRAQRLEEIGGHLFLVELSESVPTSANAVHYARVVHEKAMLRRIIALGGTTAASAYDPAARADEVFEKLQAELVELIGERRGRRALSSYTAVEQTMHYLEALKQRGDYLSGVGSGFPELDNITTGFNDGELIIIAARPSMGKTSLAMNMARHAAGRYNCPVAVFSLEMEVKQLVLRMMSAEAHIGLQKLRSTARLTPEEYSRLSGAVARLTSLPIYFDDSAGLTIETLRARARQLWIEHQIKLVVVDYLQLIQPPRMVQSQQQWIAFVSASLKSLAKELKIPIICLSQLSRAPEKRSDYKPMLSDLRDSGAIEQDADVVMFVYRPEVYKDVVKELKSESKDGPKVYEIEGRNYPVTGLAEIIVAKNRNGPTGSVPLSFVGKFTMFANLTTEGEMASVATSLSDPDTEPESYYSEDGSEPSGDDAPF